MPTFDEALHPGAWLRLIALIAYAAAFVGSAGRPLLRRWPVQQLATWSALAGVLAHSAALGVSWIAAGRTELALRGNPLSVGARLWTLISHPPWGTLPDAFDLAAWGLVMGFLLLDGPRRLRALAATALGLALVALIESALVGAQPLAPLPILRGAWMLGRIGLLAAGAALCAVGATGALLHLLRWAAHATPALPRRLTLLPRPRALQDFTDRLVLAGWPLLTVGIVMGGLWAGGTLVQNPAATGREAWEVVAWVATASYLHARLALGWKGHRAAALAVFALALAAGTFLGVRA